MSKSKRHYSASLSQSQGRTGYSVIFRHPTRVDAGTGKPGLRVRRGLGTRELSEAERLLDELNKLLSDPRYHEPTARAEAERRFDSRVIDIFFHKMVPEGFDFVGLREEMIPLPLSEPEGYRRVLFLGTTGAGKTTLVRQIIGTDPKGERFPSTSTAKATIHDIEIVLDDGPWRAVVTFVSNEEVRAALSECISAAALAASQGADDAMILQRLLNHVDQRFRFNYILGNGPEVQNGHSDFDDEEDEVERSGEIALSRTAEVLAKTVARLRELATGLRDQVREYLDVHGNDEERVSDEIFEEELDHLLRDDEAFHEIADDLMDEIEKRFDLLPAEELRKTRSGWPLAWSGEWPPEKRGEFLKVISQLSSNHAPLFGRLLTPLVNGMRVAGQFSPPWAPGTDHKLVLLDGEGLGHTPTSSSSVSTTVSRRIKDADAVLLVDNATQPMQAAPLAAMREVVLSGNARKLILAFTHFDAVKGDNLPDPPARARHVLASAENVLASIGEDLGPPAVRVLRARVEKARFFLASLHEPLSEDTSAGKRTIRQLQKLLGAVDQVIQRPQPVEARPVYARINLTLAIQAAARAFHESWRPRLGLQPGKKEHWTRVKALNRRVAEGWADEYDTLRPVADLGKELKEQIYVFLQNPLRWDGPQPSDEEKQSKYDELADNISERVLELATRRVRREPAGKWIEAYSKWGRGSTFDRARIIGDEIYTPGVPVPDVTPSPDRNKFLHEVVAEVEDVAKKIGAVLA